MPQKPSATLHLLDRVVFGGAVLYAAASILSLLFCLWLAVGMGPHATWRRWFVIPILLAISLVIILLPMLTGWFVAWSGRVRRAAATDRRAVKFDALRGMIAVFGGALLTLLLLSFILYGTVGRAPDTSNVIALLVLAPIPIIFGALGALVYSLSHERAPESASS